MEDAKLIVRVPVSTLAKEYSKYEKMSGFGFIDVSVNYDLESGSACWELDWNGVKSWFQCNLVYVKKGAKIKFQIRQWDMRALCRLAKDLQRRGFREMEIAVYYGVLEVVNEDFEIWLF